MNNASLQELIEQSSAGNVRAFEALTKHLDQKLFAYVISRVRTRDSALDVVADTLASVWRSLASFRYTTDAGFYRFVYTIAKRELYRVWREPSNVSLEDAPEIASEETRAGNENRIAVMQVVEQLEKTARDIVVLRHWSGFSFGEIAVMLKMTESAVRVRHHRALITMRTTLQPYV